MADENEANGARAQNRVTLMKTGAHALGVEEGRPHGKKGWVVVAHVAPDAQVTLPQTLSYDSSGGPVSVPLVVRRTEPFKPE